MKQSENYQQCSCPLNILRYYQSSWSDYYIYYYIVLDKAPNIGGQYLRKCDSVQYANSFIENKLTIRGMKYVNMGNIQCDGDGAYGKYNISAGM